MSIQKNIPTFPIKIQTLRRMAALQDICPECGGQLDTGWECSKCQFDARPLMAEQYGLKRNGSTSGNSNA